ncbi:MAG: hypothetical protein ABI144_11310 [Gallionella sp.]
MSAKHIAIIDHSPGRQRGAALMVMLVIMIVGAAAILVSSLSSAALKNARDKTTAEALAQAKDALIGRAVSDTTVPGSLPCPDSTGNGSADLFSGNQCPTYIGKLPWKTLGLPDLRDGSGEELWYALSINFRDVTTSVVNSDTPGTISVFAPDGTLLNDGSGTTGAVAVIIAPGSVLTRQGGVVQDRSTAGFNTASNYLDVATVGGNAQDNAVFSGSSTSTTGFIQGVMKDSSGNVIVNDQLLVITRNQLMPGVEMRIAHEVKNCLDNYAADSSNTNHRYPWAALVSNTNTWPSRNGDNDVRFGRVSETPDTSTTSGSPPTGTLLTYIQNVQNALNVYLNAPTSGNLSTLQDKGDHLKDYATSGTPAYQAGYTADHCSGLSCTSTLQSQLDTAMGAGSDPTMPADWTFACQSFFRSTSPQSYWTDWRDLVFFQVADGYQPGGGTFTPLHISGSGNTVVDNNTYRAAVLVGRKTLTGQQRLSSTDIYPTTPPDNYLETLGGSTNSHQSAVGVTPSTSFITYKSFDPSYSTVNDLVLCLDGAGTNSGSVCK